MNEKTFLECVKECGDQEKHLLLGNGFSISLHDKFHYNSLFEKCSKATDKIFCEFSEKLNTTNLEKIIEAIINDANLSQSSENHIESIKESFLYAIKDIHPNSWEIEVETQLAFLKCFKTLFTTNYDLLVYWHIAKTELSDPTNPIFRDGFGGHLPLTWRNSDLQNLYYLHGALHLHLSKNNILEKNSFQGVDNIPLLDQLTMKLFNKEWPHIVLEGTAEKKLHAINSSLYLKHSFKNFQEIQGTLFLHGVSFSDQDKHIYDAINSNNNISKIFISIHKDNSVIDRAEKLLSSKNGKLDFYDAESIKNLTPDSSSC